MTGYRFEKLIVWQLAMEFCIEAYRITRAFPDEERYGLTSQLRRAATAMPLNIAEGSGCRTKKEFTQFLFIALRSEYEVVTILKLALRLSYIDEQTHETMQAKVAEIGRKLQALINSFQGSANNK
jgi:four helix bundle protein